MVLVGQRAVEAQLFAVLPLFEVLAVGLGRDLRVAVLVGLPHLRPNVARNARVCSLVEGVELHTLAFSRVSRRNSMSPTGGSQRGVEPHPTFSISDGRSS